MTPLLSPQVQIITDLPTVSEAALFERLSRAASLPLAARESLSVQLRDPGLPVRDLVRLGLSLRRVTRDLGARLIVNDRVDVALLIEADGVHLGRRSMSVGDARAVCLDGTASGPKPRGAARAIVGPGAWISTSAHSVDDVLVSARAGANAVLLSPIFTSPGKGQPLGPQALTEAREALSREGLSLSLFALGGIDLDTARDCLDAGADGVAAIRADLLPLLALSPKAR